MKISEAIHKLKEIRQQYGEIEVLGYINTGWYSSAMGYGEITALQRSVHQKYVVSLRTDTSLERD